MPVPSRYKKGMQFQDYAARLELLHFDFAS